MTRRDSLQEVSVESRVSVQSWAGSLSSNVLFQDLLLLCLCPESLNKIEFTNHWLIWFAKLQDRQEFSLFLNNIVLLIKKVTTHHWIRDLRIPFAATEMISWRWTTIHQRPNLVKIQFNLKESPVESVYFSQQLQEKAFPASACRHWLSFDSIGPGYVSGSQ